MKHKYEEIISVRVTPLCTQDGCDGELHRADNRALLTSPMQHRLICTKCKTTILSTESGQRTTFMTRAEFEAIIAKES